MREKIKRFLPGVTIISFLALMQTGCVTIFSDFQSADTLGKGNIEVTPAVSAVQWHNEGESEYVQTNVGIQAGVGLNETTDIRFRFEVPAIGDNFDYLGDYYVIGAGPKVSVIEDKLAIYTPVGFAFGEDIEASDSFEIQPTALFTFPLNEFVEVNPSAKFIFPFHDDRSAMGALNFGLALWNKNFGIRPEVGFMKSLEGDEGTFVHIGIGFSIRNRDKN